LHNASITGSKKRKLFTAQSNLLASLIDLLGFYAPRNQVLPQANLSFLRISLYVNEDVDGWDRYKKHKIQVYVHVEDEITPTLAWPLINA